MYNELTREIEASSFLRRPMKENGEHSGEARWKRKDVANERLLPLAADFDNLKHTGVGSIGICRDQSRSRSPDGSVCLTIPLVLPEINPTHRAYNIPEVYRPLDREDLSAYNRITYWIYAEAPGVHSFFTHISLHNDGEHIMPVPGRFEGTHHTTVPTGQWTQVLWEFPSIYRDVVTAFSVGVYVVGCQQSGGGAGTRATAKIYIDDMRIGTVEEENYKGFGLRRGSLAYAHCGYLTGSRKQALARADDMNARGVDGVPFQLIKDDGAESYTGLSKALPDGYLLMDFTDFDEPGLYALCIRGLTSGRFYIGPDAYQDVAWKVLNFFRGQRCGADVPMVHTECHLDATCTHPDGRKISVAGGWHDAADLTQGIANTAESAYAMMELAENQSTNEGLRTLLLDEARRGLNWVMRTRFGDGYRHGGMIIGIWTENYFGDGDDMDAKAVNRPIANFQAAALCAKGYKAFSYDRIFAQWCLRCATEDYSFAVDAMNAAPVINEPSLFSQAALAALELHKITGDSSYMADAVRFAGRVIACQQLEPKTEWTVPLRGFFYETAAKTRTLAFFHACTEFLPLQAITSLLAYDPLNPNAPLWRESVAAYTDLIFEYDKLGGLYGLLPSYIYETDNTDYSGLYHEGDRTVGQPTIEEYNAQVRNGIRLSDTHYLRRFPVAYQFRGFHAIHLSRAKAIFYAAKIMNNPRLRQIAMRQIEWILGYNPFALSSVYGVGYDFPPLYTGLMPAVVGAVPVGFETFENEDEPYFPMQSHATYKEIWTHTSCRLLWLMSDIF